MLLSAQLPQVVWPMSLTSLDRKMADPDHLDLQGPNELLPQTLHGICGHCGHRLALQVPLADSCPPEKTQQWRLEQHLHASAEE
jgi:hypothetical protein